MSEEYMTSVLMLENTEPKKKNQGPRWKKYRIDITC